MMTDESLASILVSAMEVANDIMSRQNASPVGMGATKVELDWAQKVRAVAMHRMCVDIPHDTPLSTPKFTVDCPIVPPSDHRREELRKWSFSELWAECCQHGICGGPEIEMHNGMPDAGFEERNRGILITRLIAFEKAVAAKEATT